MIGQTLGSYRIIEQIGLGGMATIYKAYDPDTDRYVAIKMLPQHFSKDPAFKERFQREAKAIARLEHLHILPIFAYGDVDGIAYMAMRYMQAGTLTDLIRKGPLPLPEASRILSQVSSALDHAHSFGILHRDIKPSNILLDDKNNAYLTDFGIAKILESTMDLTRGDILGTPAYMSPEQCKGNATITAASDIYALGIVLYEMVTGRTPFHAETPIALIFMQLNEPLPMPRQLRRDLPEAAEKVIFKALAKEPEDRFATCQAMADAFAQAIAGTDPLTAAPSLATEEDIGSTQKITPPEKTTSLPAPAPKKGNWLVPVIVVGLLALFICGTLLGLAVFSNRRDNNRIVATIQSSAPTEVFTEATLAPKIIEAIPVNTPYTIELLTATPDSPPTEQPLEPTPEFVPNELYFVDWCAEAGDGGGLCIYSADSDQPLPLEFDQNFDPERFWGYNLSPWGDQLVFSAAPIDDPDNHLYLSNMDGSDLYQIPIDGNLVDPAWNPYEDILAFYQNGDLVTATIDGENLQTLLAVDDVGCSFSPQWSPDGDYLVVSVHPQGCDWEFPLTREIYVVSADGADVYMVYPTIHESERCSDMTVAFSPDGGQIAYIDGNCQSYLISADGTGEPELIAEFPWDWTGQIFPQWPELEN